MEKNKHNGGRERDPCGIEEIPLHHNQTSAPQTISSATNTGEKRKREGLVSRERESGVNNSETEEVILVGDIKAIKDFGLNGGKHSQSSVSNKRQALYEGSLEKEEAGERAKQDSTFNDFDKAREESKFAPGQTWALYDTDGMPRLYAHIRKVSVPGFCVSVTWLEPDPDENEQLQTYEKDLPVSVGRFKLGNNEDIKDHGRFSHVVHCNEGSSSGKFTVYPREGETWVVFKGRYKNYHVEWTPDPDSHHKYPTAFVDILPEPHGHVRVAFLHKAKGFASVFCRFTEKTDYAYISRNDLYQFSHRVPSFKMTGCEAEGMPRGAYELDPSALPENITEIDVPLHLLTEPTVSNPDTSLCVHFASKGRTFQTGQIWAFRSGDDCFPRYYGQIQKITFVQAFEQDPVVKLHVSRLRAKNSKGIIQWSDKKMPVGCGSFRARKPLEIFTDLDVFSREVSLDSSEDDGNDYTIMPKTGDVWAIYRNWSENIEVTDLQSQMYDLVEVLDVKKDYKVLLLAPYGGFKSANGAGFGSVYMAATEHWIDGADVRFTIPKPEMLRFSHQVPTSKVRKEMNGVLQEVYEPNF